MILKDVYSTAGTRFDIAPYIVGAGSLFLFVNTIIQLANGEILFLQNQLTKNGVYLLCEICFASIFITFMIKKAKNKRNLEKE